MSSLEISGKLLIIQFIQPGYTIMLTKILLLLLIAFIGWLIYSTIKHNPQAFSKENLNKSFYLLGWLALGLIGFVALLVFLLKI